MRWPSVALGPHPDHPALERAAADLRDIAAWLEYRHPGRGIPAVFAYDLHRPDGAVGEVVVLSTLSHRVVDAELSRLAQDAVRALGWPDVPWAEAVPLPIPDHRTLPAHARLRAIARLEGALSRP